MKTIRNGLLSIIALSSLIMASGCSGTGADASWKSLFGQQYHVEGEQGTQYVEECGACHLAYPAPLLTADSWLRILSGLDNHFGENAELLPDSQTAIQAFLTDNAADSQTGQRSKLGKFARRQQNDGPAPLRITDLKGFHSQHHEVDKQRMVTNNPDVRHFSQCNACHGNDAERGFFDEDTVTIPNFPHWD